MGNFYLKSLKSKIVSVLWILLLLCCNSVIAASDKNEEKHTECSKTEHSINSEIEQQTFATCAEDGWCRHEVTVVNNGNCTIDVWCIETGCAGEEYNMGTIGPGQSVVMSPSAYDATISIAYNNQYIYNYPALDVDGTCKTYSFTYTDSPCVSNPCASSGGDSDNDGVCNNQDCQPFNASLPTSPGTPCNDGNASTVNDVIQADGCSCAGDVQGFATCAEDGWCRHEVTVVNNGNCTIDVWCIETGCAGEEYNMGTIGPGQSVVMSPSAYDATISIAYNNQYIYNYPALDVDGTCKTYNFTYTDSPCVFDPCASSGGDSDNDGVCNNQDCQPFNASLPTSPGTPCNDGNASTVNDVIQADGCSCAGDVQGFATCAEDGWCRHEVTVVNNGNCIIDVWCIETGCAGEEYNMGTIGPGQSIVILPSAYDATISIAYNNQYIYNYPALDVDGTCKTYNFTYTDSPCVFDPCASAGGDSDNDGICNNQDCQPFNPNLPTNPGTACNDNDGNTSNDVIQSDGCTCLGTFDPCANAGGDSNNDGICDNICDLGATTGAPIYNDNGTPSNLGDDTFTFLVTITGNNSAGWQGGGKSGNYGQTVQYGPYPVGQNGVIITITDVALGEDCQTTVSANLQTCTYTGDCPCCTTD